jgi:iron complex transport system substrate-binding protein
MPIISMSPERNTSIKNDCVVAYERHAPFRVKPTVWGMIGLCVFSGLLSGCRARPTIRDGVTYQDMAGRSVRMSRHPTRIVSNGGAIDTWILMLNAQDRLVSTSSGNKKKPWFRKFFPGIMNLPTAFNGTTVNTEELIRLKPDVVYVLSGLDLQQYVEKTGIPVFVLDRRNPKEMESAVKLLAHTLGNQQEAIANQYTAYFDRVRKMVSERVQSRKHAMPLKVFYASGANALATDGKDTLADTWIHDAGDINVASAHGLAGMNKSVTMEDLIQWNPDVVIASSTQAADNLQNDPRWKQISAVKNGRIYVNPCGLYLWSIRSTEVAIQTLWVATVLHPELFKDIDMVTETQRFYKQFFRYDLDADEANSILHPQ